MISEKTISLSKLHLNKDLSLYPKCTNPEPYNPDYVNFLNVILPTWLSVIDSMDPTPEGCIPGPGPRGLGRDNSDDGIREINGSGLVFSGKRCSVLYFLLGLKIDLQLTSILQAQAIKLI